MELHRLRNEIILSASETGVLEHIYLEQQKVCACQNIKVELADSISFIDLDTLKGGDRVVNFLDEGPAAHLKIGLAIREFDPNLLSNFNFRSPDTLKFNVLDSGLEEVRAILQYQMM